MRVCNYKLWLCLSENAIIFVLLSWWGITGYGILNWQAYYFCTVRILMYCLLTSVMTSNILISKSYSFVGELHYLSRLRFCYIFPFFFFFSLTMIFHVWTYFYLSQWASLIWGVISFTNTWKFSVSLIITTPHSHSFWLPELLIDLYFIFIIYIPCL